MSAASLFTSFHLLDDTLEKGTTVPSLDNKYLKINLATLLDLYSSLKPSSKVHKTNR